MACDAAGLAYSSPVGGAISLTRFYRGEAEAADVLQGVTSAMGQLAGHRENVRKHDAPELALFGGDDE